MKYLVDTHVIIWMWLTPEKICHPVRAILENEELYVSLASIWEAGIKWRRKKIVLPFSRLEDMLRQLKKDNFNFLSLKDRHIHEAIKLPLHHNDPFDRMLIAQAVTEGLVLITDDALINQYNVKTLSPTR